MNYRPAGTRAADIAADVEAAVAAGRATPGMLLPTVRALATELGIAPGTVAAAYRLLAQRGVVEGHARAGTRIRARPGAVPARGVLVPSGTRDLATGNPDPALLPDLGKALAAIAKRQDRRLYGEPRVDAEFADAARAQFAADGIPVEAVTVTGGAMDAIERTLAAHLRPGMRVAVEDPGYAGVLDLLEAMGLVPEPVRLDAEGMRPDGLAAALAKGAQAAIVTPRAQNPTGAALTAGRARALRAACRDFPGVLVIEDDHAGEVSGAPAVSLKHPRSIVVRSASKSLGPDLRVAVVGGDAQTIGAVESRAAVGAGWVSHVLQDLVRQLTPVKGATATYTARREALLGALEARGVRASGRSGFNVWVPVAEEAPVVAAMAVRGWAVAGGARFRIASPPAVRVTISTLGVEEADRVAEDLAASLQAGGHTRTG